MQTEIQSPKIKAQLDEANLRRTSRIKMNIPIQVTGYNSQTARWQEMSRILDVSRVGASFNVHHAVMQGLILFMSFPMPWRLRQFAHSDPSYKIYGIVRNTTNQKENENRVGVEFLGQTPPQTYIEKPWTVFKQSEWKGDERRRDERKRITEQVWVEYYQGKDELVGLEQGCTENVSNSGARICVQEPPIEFDRVKVFALGSGFESYAKIANTFMGKDGIHRLCVEFVDMQWKA